MSYLLPHLHSGWAVDQCILGEEDRVVVLRFGHDHDEVCMLMDEVLAGELLGQVGAAAWRAAAVPGRTDALTGGGNSNAPVACRLLSSSRAGIADQVKNFACIYLVDISEVPDFNTMCVGGHAERGPGLVGRGGAASLGALLAGLLTRVLTTAL